VTRISDASYRRNRELQRKRNLRSNPERAREYGRISSDVRRLERRNFVGWDGEGYRAFAVDANGQAAILHRYMLFGCSTGHHVTGIDLGTIECLDLILFTEQQDPQAFHVGFSFEYDVNMILRDLEWRHLAMLHDTGVVKWKGYRIKHVPHKMFSVSKNGVSATIYDVFGFFHVSYLRALRKFGIGTPEALSKIEAGKNLRSSFSYAELPMIISYWSEEIALLPALMDYLREACYGAGFYITQWHGPGALASFALKKYGVHAWHAQKVPRPVQVARRLAYAGGRFQAWRCGYYPGPAYTADINSAYAYACSMLPRLDKGQWVCGDPKIVKSARDISHFALYRIRFDATEMERTAREECIPFPLFHRDGKGFLTWPSKTEGWYWSPEAALVAGSRHAKFLEVWEWRGSDMRPFSFISSAYDRRVQLQLAGNPVEQAYKWFLASIYGQFAQRVGWDRAKRSAPRSHQLEWAGFITSYCRALVYRAAVDVARRGGLISIDTDGVTSIVPFRAETLPGGVGSRLGEWKLEDFDSILFWQNGIYWLKDRDGKWKDPKTRGVPRGTIPRDSAMACLDAHDWIQGSGNPHISAVRNRFIGYRQAMQHRFDSWRRWQEDPISIEFGGSGKGRHVASLCAKCTSIRVSSAQRGNGEEPVLHTVTHFYDSDPLSKAHKLPWLEPVDRDGSVNVQDMGIWEDDAYI
jgi:hypothetical protein